MESIQGLHHVTAIASDAAVNVVFYTEHLGLRLVKQTVNFDDPHTYHLYYGDETGTPGSLLTFFPWGSSGHRGRAGNGQTEAIAFAIPEGSLAFWHHRLSGKNIPVVGPVKRFGEEVLILFDQDEFQIELVASSGDHRHGWKGSNVPGEYALRGLHSVTLSEEHLHPTAGFMEAALGAKRMGKEENRHRYAIAGAGPGAVVDVLVRSDRRGGLMGCGMVHHVAFRTPDDESQARIRDSLLDARHQVTDIADRQYFKSIYFREPGGTLFEVATDIPGFTRDESKDELGSRLQLPAWLEHDRISIERVLPPIRRNAEARVAS